MTGLDGWEEHGDEAPKAPSVGKAWMVTFTDLVSLMLTFFVMLFAMSTVQLDKWQEIVESLSRSETLAETETLIPPKSQYNISTSFRRRSISLEYLEAVLGEKMPLEETLAQSRLKLAEDRLIVSLPGDLLFEKGSAVLSEGAVRALFTLGGVLRNIENPIAVAGHSDRDPVTGRSYASNWELSMGRAVSVANALRRSGYTEEIQAYGYGESHYHLLPEIEPVEQRDRLARRVDIFILSSSGG